jgi:hypothetical protein
VAGNQTMASGASGQPTSKSAGREPDAIYQAGKVVGRVIDPEIDPEAKEIHFGEIYESDWLLLPEECEYLQYRIVIQNVRDATKVSADSRQRGRILRGCIADIVGYREN